jgi:hypothetical protein
MKVGDLVRMKRGDGVFGLVTDLENPTSVLRRGPCQDHHLVGILWADGTGIDYEPKAWLEVVNESR